MTGYNVPFNKPCFLGSELEFMRQAIAENGQISGAGQFTKRCEGLLREMLGAPALLCTSGTHAIEMCAILLDISPGDEVLLPSFTFVSTANAFLLRGAILRFVDNDQYGNIDIDSCREMISPKTRAVLAVHYGGNSSDMEALRDLCREHRVHLVEDAAQAIGSKFKGRPLGTFGTLGCLSFHETKNVTSGEGGALIVNDEALLDRAEILREKGTNRRQFLQGLIDKYTWVDIGSSYVMSELNAAYLWPQLERLEEINHRRRSLWERYARGLRAPLASAGAQVVENPAHNTPNGHLFAVLMASQSQRADLMQFLKRRSVLAPFHYVALHTSPMGMKFLNGSVSSADLENCAKFSECLIRLPLYYSLTESDQEHVIRAVEDWSASR